MIRSSPDRSRSRIPRRPGFTLVEMLVVLTVLGALAVGGAGISARVVGYFSTRTAAEQFAWDIRNARAYRMRFGILPILNPPGIYVFDGIWENPGGGAPIIGVGNSYVMYGEYSRVGQIIDGTTLAGFINRGGDMFDIHRFPRGVRIRDTGGAIVSDVNVCQFDGFGNQVIPGLQPFTIGTLTPGGVPAGAQFTLTFSGAAAGGGGYPLLQQVPGAIEQ